MRIAAAALALVLACGACAGKYTPGQPYDSPDGSLTPVGVGGGGGDGGTDAGADAGPDAGSDGGCTTLSTSVPVFDGCAGGVAATESISVTPPGCTVLITFNDLNHCEGVAIGSSDAFDGGCGSGGPACYSTSLPGTIHCGSCSIVLCDGGPCP
jgi:hypothetical protein